MPRSARVLVTAIAVLSALCASAQDAANPRHVWLGEARTDGDALIVPLVIDDLSGVVAGDVNLRFDGTAVDSITAESTDLLGGFFFLANAVGDTLKMAFASASPASGSGAFAEVKLMPADADPDFAFTLVSLNGDQIPVTYDPATSVSDSTSLGHIKRAIRHQ